MEKIELAKYCENELKITEAIKKFVAKLYDCDVSNSWIDDMFVVKEQWWPQHTKVTVYMDCTQEIIDKLLSFESEYVSYTKKVKTIRGLHRNGSMQFEVYNIKYNEKAWRIDEVNFIVVKDDFGGRARDVMVAEEELKLAKERLDTYNVIF